MSTTLVRAPHFRVTALPRRHALPRLKLFLRLLGATLAALQAWNGRHAINPDGVSYLDVASAYLRGDWHAAVSTYWSPLYSWLIAGALAVLRPSPYWEFASLKVVNFAIFLTALAAFEWFLHEAAHPRRPRGADASDSAPLPRGVLVAGAYGLFFWSSCVLTSLAGVTPDLLASVFVYLAAASVLRARRVPPGVAGSAAFGLILGAGCLAKIVLLPLGLLFLLASLFAVGSVRKAAVYFGAASAVLALVVGAWVGAMYARSGRLTLGDTSRLNYVWLVNRVADHGWETDDPRLGTAVHPPRRLPSEPPVYEFAAPVAGTCPLWYDPSYWCEGLTGRFDARQQASALLRNAQAYFYLFFENLAPLTAAVAVLHLGAWLLSPGGFRTKGAARLRDLVRQYPMLLPALGACGLYALVVVEPRYLTGFVVLLGMAGLLTVRFPASRRTDARCWGWAVVVVMVLAPAVGLVLQQAVRAGQDAGKSDGAAHPDWQVAAELQRRGVRSGDRVGVVGSSFYCGWARVGRFQAAAEVRPCDAHAFWAAEAARQDEVMDAFRKAGVVAVVARDVPESARDWGRIQGTDYAVRMLPLPGGP